ncbi:hypothetical protein UA08_02341 [Talaromyces atroroseus]|uniref:Uncharacterized protein n=1 Tax=Talaromyces atroroseus TaxID=1441469 RepID=A0A225AL16_TALAT|nr:hypothetical protein UA08_02341 [Talaromyces atroroseus]OKL62232.1 hypothetical protein UA08_02341 [Talaromyces atroroseus]
MKQTAREALELTPSRTGRPRLDKSSRILARFYEPLFLLQALGQTRGVHTRRERDSNDVTETRRKFLENLCFVCDFAQGGESCTAIGLEERVDKYVFWLASNGKHPNIADFLKSALKFLCLTASHLAELEPDATEREFTQICADFAKIRINEQWKRMLQQILGQDDPIKLCYFAYDNRRSTMIAELKSLASSEERGLSLDGQRSSFYLVQHYIGRLAHHIRAPRELIQDSRNIEHILQTCTVEIVDLPGVQIPLRDTHTNLKGILNRMFREDNANEKEEVEEGLIYLDKVSGTFNKFVGCYKRSGVDADVHAEIKVLEHFHRSKLRFAGNDRFIACSKPACLCCELYFKHHPAYFVTPSSHKKVWPKWSPPKVKYGPILDDWAIQQRKILSKITEDLREQVINHVLQRSRNSHWHPDSRTGITDLQSMNHQAFSMESDYSELSELESDFNSLDGSESEMWSDSEDGGVSVSV